MSTEKSLLTLISRLESITARIEKLEASQSSSCQSSSAASSIASPSDSASISAFDEIVAQNLNDYFQISGILGGEIATQAEDFKQVIAIEREFLVSSSKCKKPSDEVLVKWFQNHLSPLMLKVSDASQKAGKSSPNFKNLATVSEGVNIFQWPFNAPTPVKFIHETIGSSQYHSNVLRRDFKDKNENQVKWVNAFDGFLKSFENFIKVHYTTGVVWNPNGMEFKVDSNASGSTPASTTPTASQINKSNSSTSKDSGGAAPPASALFAELNKGVGISSGLRKVTADMKTKNRADRVGLVNEQPKRASTSSTPSGKVYPPKVELEGIRWCVEYVRDTTTIQTNSLKEIVRLYKCEGATIIIKGKFNAITVDLCKKTNIVFDEVISVAEIINCNSVKIQVLDCVPSITIDKCSGVHVYLSRKSLHTQIITSKSDELNVSIPGATENDEPTEYPIPEQYVNYFKDGKMRSEANTHLGE